jgi:hypothetical protein
MTPKEKALNIIEWFGGDTKSLDQPKVSALILVNMFMKFGTENESLKYWIEVKEELLKL